MIKQNENTIIIIFTRIGYGDAKSMKTNQKTYIFFIFHFLYFISNGQQDMPFKVESMFNMELPETLGLEFAKDLETFTIFSPDSTENKYNHGVVLYPFKGMLYAQWQSSVKDEDAPDTQVLFSRSANGIDWEKPKALAKSCVGGIKTSGGWWSFGETLVAFLAVWPNKNNDFKEGYTEYITSTDGIHWDNPHPVTDLSGKAVFGIIEQDVNTLPNGRLITAFHLQPGLIVKPFYTDDPKGISGWTQGNMTNLPTNQKGMSRELEPSWFYKKNGSVVMVFRDQHSSFKKLASVSKDDGVNWSNPVIIDTPDSRAKQSAGNLPDGTAYMVNNPSGSKDRFPLVITLSKDGNVFDKAFLIRSGGKDLQPMRFEGKYKRKSYSYPKSVLWGKYLYIGYATNKEDIELTRIPIENLIQISTLQNKY